VFVKPSANLLIRASRLDKSRREETA
jgi:hypothetical protein